MWAGYFARELWERSAQIDDAGSIVFSRLASAMLRSTYPSSEASAEEKPPVTARVVMWTADI
eukprot:scaffold128165_cov17-Prasinocladus_malaysianus.AAC.1